MATLKKDIVVVGGSAGAFEALRTVVAGLPGDLPASLFVVLHTAPDAPSLLSKLLSRSGPLPAHPASHEETFSPGRIYVAPPDRHLLLYDGHTLLSRGPRENRARPAIDPLFRSAAVELTTRVIGVLLSGYQDDGVAGLAAIRQCGGLTIVQSPGDALVSELPEAALRAVDVDYEVPAAEMAPLLRRLVAQTAGPPPEVPEGLRLEVLLQHQVESELARSHRLGQEVALGCPDCGGPLRQMDDKRVIRFRCAVGHALSAASLLDGQGREVERALWIALRTLEDRARLLRKMNEDMRGRMPLTRIDSEIEECGRHADELRRLLARLFGAKTEAPTS